MGIQIGEAVGGDGVVLNHHRFVVDQPQPDHDVHGSGDCQLRVPPNRDLDRAPLNRHQSGSRDVAPLEHSLGEREDTRCMPFELGFGDIRAGSLASAQQPAALEDSQRAAQGESAGAQSLAQFTFRGQPVAGMELSGLDLIEQSLGDLDIQRQGGNQAAGRPVKSNRR